jgi:hypothetical protein
MHEESVWGGSPILMEKLKKPSAAIPHPVTRLTEQFHMAAQQGFPFTKFNTIQDN